MVCSVGLVFTLFGFNDSLWWRDFVCWCGDLLGFSFVVLAVLLMCLLWWCFDCVVWGECV